jgi:hypothetical protein
MSTPLEQPRPVKIGDAGGKPIARNAGVPRLAN